MRYALSLKYFSNGAYGFRGGIPSRNRRWHIVHGTGFPRPCLRMTVQSSRTPVAANIQRYEYRADEIALVGP